MLRGPGALHPRRGDGPVLGPAHELAGPRPGRANSGVQLRRPLPGEAGPGGQPPGDGADVPRPGPGHPHRGGLRRHHRVFPGGGEVPPGRPQELRRVPDAARDSGPGRRLPGVREEADRGGGAPGGGAGGASRILLLILKRVQA